MISRIKVFIGFLVPCIILAYLIHKTSKSSNENKDAKTKMLILENERLKSEIMDLEHDLVFLSNDYERVYEENQVFTSLLGMIENEPGGSEILKRLWEPYSNEER